MIHSAHKRRQTDDAEGEDDEGGINVAVAAKRLRVEDKVDKALERERVKQKHRVSSPLGCMADELAIETHTNRRMHAHMHTHVLARKN